MSNLVSPLVFGLGLLLMSCSIWGYMRSSKKWDHTKQHKGIAITFLLVEGWLLTTFSYPFFSDAFFNGMLVGQIYVVLWSSYKERVNQ
jgi:hypothetical protein